MLLDLSLETPAHPDSFRSMLLILAPIPLVAASFIILGQVIRRLGQQYSRLNAKWCTYTRHMSFPHVHTSHSFQ